VERMLRGAAAVIVLTLLLAACTRTENPKAQVAESAPQTLVTFVELGSVNCIPCRMMQPIMRDIENTYPGQVRVVFHDVWTDEGKPYAKTYGIRVIPTQVFLLRASSTFATRDTSRRTSWSRFSRPRE
jgi:thioredoxin 1